jgi:ribonuclease HI
MIVTINTDASFSQKHKKGTFAFWIKCDKGKIAESGVLKGETPCPTTAEMKCILNALHRVVNAEWKDEITKIIVNTDALNAIHIFANDEKSIKKFKLGLWKFTLLSSAYRKLARQLQKAEIEFRHIKAHQHTSTKRNWVNDWCDGEAKKQIAKFLAEQK